jgi:peptidoglycan/LPS O-acetylase OafA/YrhL
VRLTDGKGALGRRGPRQPSATATSPRPSRIRGLDGIRAIAVLVVFGFHSQWPHLVGGWLGVDIFFVLSGFLITTLLLREQSSQGRIALLRFYFRRLCRLLPALGLLFLVLAIYYKADHSLAGHQTRLFMPWAISLVPNWRLIAFDPLTTGAYALSVIGHTWTLGVEEQFYVVWPLLLIALTALLRSRRVITAVVTGLACCAGAYEIWGWHVGLGSLRPNTQGLHDRLYWGTDTHAYGLLFGCAAALYLTTRADEGRAAVSRWGAWLLRATALAGTIYIAAVAWLAPSDAFLDSGGEVAIACATAVVLWYLAACPDRVTLAVLEWPPVRWIGRLSYGIYLWSIPVVVIVGERILVLGSYFLQLAEFAVAVLCASVSYYLVERPISRRAAGWGRVNSSAADPGPAVTPAARTAPAQPEPAPAVSRP